MSHRLWLTQWVTHPNDDLPRLEQRQIGFAVDHVRTERANLQDAIGGEGFHPTDNLGTFVGILSVGEAGRFARSGFDEQIVSRLDECGNRRGDQGDAAFARKGLFGNGNFHGNSSRIGQR